MDIRNWCSSGNRSSRSIRLGRDNHHHDHQSNSSSSVTSPYKRRYWKVLWMRLKKKSVINVFEPHHQCGAGHYDPCSYSQNFDHGFAWDDHDDNLSRSFSFRFSDPSCIDVFVDLDKKQVISTSIISNIGVERKEWCV